jgi:hypothetical protein
MAIQVIWDQVQGSERRLAVRESGYDVRSGLVLGLSDLDFASYELLSKAILSSDNPPPNEHPDASLAAQGFVLYDVIVRPDSAQTARIWARYQPIAFSGSPVEGLAMEGRSQEHYEQFERHPRTGKPFTVALPSDPPETTPSVSSHDPASAKVNLATLGYPEHLDVITCYGLFRAVPSELHLLRKKVNDAAWPPAASAPSFSMTQGVSAAGALGLSPRPRGHWLATPLDWRWSQRDGRFAVSFSLLSRGDRQGEDWSAYTFAVNPATGKKIAPDSALMTALLAQSYEDDIRNNNGGVLKSGNFETISFSSILGPFLNGTFLGNRNPFGFTT